MDLVFENVRKVFSGGVTAVDDFSLTVSSPTMAVLVGPSGCGKTTLLRLIAGLDRLTSGAIYLGERRLDNLSPKDRDIAMVFQGYALYPHMTVAQNLSFGLRLRKIPKERISSRVSDVAKTLEIEQLLDRKPGELSGGQRQRVALGRAVIREPRVFLFDEPLSNLDARLRSDMRAMIKKLYADLKTTSIYVTHDQVEAMTIGEQLVVMNEGRIHQVGAPHECYSHPRDTFVASFLGSPPMNFLDAGLAVDNGELMVADQAVFSPAQRERFAGLTDENMLIGVRPEDVAAAAVRDGYLGLRGRIVLEEPLGHETLTHIKVGPHEVIARGGDMFARDGDGNTDLFIDGEAIHVFSKRDGTRIDIPPNEHGGEARKGRSTV